VSEWEFAQENPSEQLCRLHHFAMKKNGLEFIITVREYLTPPDPTMKFYAEADKQTNQDTAPYTPVGWGPTMLVALHECMKAVHRFPYEGPAPS
jgi:hypothetical protein